ncbi:unnamed protein product, partial [Tetraodon nigroviridis]
LSALRCHTRMRAAGGPLHRPQYGENGWQRSRQGAGELAPEDLHRGAPRGPGGHSGGADQRRGGGRGVRHRRRGAGPGGAESLAGARRDASGRYAEYGPGGGGRGGGVPAGGRASAAGAEPAEREHPPGQPLRGAHLQGVPERDGAESAL